MVILTKFLFRDIVVFSGFLRVVGFSCKGNTGYVAI